jgi:hypothetical protein
MKAVVFTPTGLSYTIEAKSEEEFREKVYEAAQELRAASDY